MATRHANIAALLAHADSDLSRIEAEYQRSLDSHTIAASLRIDIKNLFENLRSVLDYLAHDIRERYCPTAKADARFYFPILPTPADFAAKTNAWYPGLQASAPQVWQLLESMQPYNPPFAWIGHFNRVNNDNKHGDLVEQTRIEVREVRATSSGGGMVTWNPSAVRFGSGVFINGVPVDPLTQLPVPHPSQRVEQITWVDFRFAEIEVSALSLMKQAAAGIRAIEAAVRPLL